jgi:hypothetical protein
MDLNDPINDAWARHDRVIQYFRSAIGPSMKDPFDPAIHNTNTAYRSWPSSYISAPKAANFP